MQDCFIYLFVFSYMFLMNIGPKKTFVAVAVSCSAVASAILLMRRMSRKNCIQALYNYHQRSKRIFICKTHQDWAECKDILFDECKKSRYLGLDCEWVTRNSSPQKVALLQLATESGTCVLFRLSQIEKPLPESILQLLGDVSILKVGVACNDDAHKLKQDYNIDVNGCVDLRHLVRQYPISSIHIPTLSLKSLAKHILGFEMLKDWRIQCGNWERTYLSQNQIDYAVQDAVIAVDIFKKIIKMKLLQSGIYRWLSYSFSKGELDIGKFWEEIYDLCKPFINKKFKEGNRSKAGSPIKVNNVKQNHIQTRAFSVSTKKWYQNIKLLAPDGQILCMCNESKARWYLDNNRAELVQDDPMIVKLNFEPKGRPILDGVYYTQEQKNICAVCGSSKSLLKRYIVPHEYRKFFPEILKNSSSHDILLVCVTCIIRGNSNDHTLRKILAKNCNAPIGTEEEVKVMENPELKKIKSAARILNKEYVSHGQKVVSYYSENEGLLQFQILWRQHFLDTMKPQYLANLWSPVHGHERVLLILESMEDSPEKLNLQNILGVKNH
ncbi:Exonuclease 3'-5' domain-containing protein 2 [Nymphon striatum]|nr:Exonuclease 3'-5' domain-containing protein 2 [Nymphon striatum]